MMFSSLTDARGLWAVCFPDDTPNFLDFYFSRVARAEDTYLDYDASGQARAHIGVLRYGCSLDASLKLAYVSGACTSPLLRKQGLMAKLMGRVLEEEAIKGTDALILIPASAELRQYYRRHFTFVDTAPMSCLELSGCCLPKSLSLPKPQPTSSLAELLCSERLSPIHISYTLKQAEDIIAEYSQSEGAVVDYVQTDCGYEALLLARQLDKDIYVDALLGQVSQMELMLGRLEGNKSIYLNHLFGQELGRPWGMVRPLSERAYGLPWHQLGISLVHN